MGDRTFGEPSPNAVPGFRGTEVDIDSLADFANAVRAELELNYRRYAKEIHSTLRGRGQPPFGRDDRLIELVAARTKYTNCVKEIQELLVNFDRATITLVKAAEVIARNYGDTDARVADVQKVVQSSRPPGRGGRQIAI